MLPMLHVLRDRIANRSVAAIASNVHRLFGVVTTCLLFPMMIFFVGCWYAAATVPEEIQEDVDLFPLLDVLWTGVCSFRISRSCSSTSASATITSFTA